MRSKPLIRSGLLTAVVVGMLALLAGPALAQSGPYDWSLADGEYQHGYDEPREREFEWLFPDYVGHLGVDFTSMPQLSESNVSVGFYYKHFEMLDGPLFAGFEITPFAFGALYDDDGYPAIHTWTSRLLFSMRLYTDLLAPKVYFEAGIGPQYIRFRATDSFAILFENGAEREDYSRWRVAGRLAVGMEISFFAIEAGYTGMFPTLEVEYTTYAPTEPIAQDRIDGMFYLALAFRFTAE